ncbi:MAG: hypothetical protein ACKOAI_08450, partial [Acidimicrobiia bacterium]
MSTNFTKLRRASLDNRLPTKSRTAGAKLAVKKMAKARTSNRLPNGKPSNLKVGLPGAASSSAVNASGVRA